MGLDLGLDPHYQPINPALWADAVSLYVSSLPKLLRFGSEEEVLDEMDVMRHLQLFLEAGQQFKVCLFTLRSHKELYQSLFHLYKMALYDFLLVIERFMQTSDISKREFFNCFSRIQHKVLQYFDKVLNIILN